MSGYSPGRRPGRKTILSDILIIVLALVIVALTVVVFILRGQYDVLIPVIFALGAVMNSIHALHCFSRDENRKRNISGTIFSLVFCVLLIVVTIISAVAIWRG